MLRTPSASRAAYRFRHRCQPRPGSTSRRLRRQSPSQRESAHDGQSKISDDDCLIQLDNFRSAVLPVPVLSATRAEVPKAVFKEPDPPPGTTFLSAFVPPAVLPPASLVVGLQPGATQTG